MFDPATGRPTPHRRAARRESGDRDGAAARASNDDRPGPGGALTPERTAAELAQLRARVIALETLVISILAGASDQDVDFASDMASYISPRPGSTRHPLTLSAADRMGGLIQRSKHMRLERPA